MAFPVLDMKPFFRWSAFHFKVKLVTNASTVPLILK